MNTKNSDVVREVYDAFKRKDLPAILALQSEEAEWSVAASTDLIPWAGPFSGGDGVAEFLRILAQWLVAEGFEIERYFTEGDQVVALGRQRGYVRPNHASYAFDFVHVWTLHAGRVTRFRVYYDTAYVAAVLAEPPR